MDETLLEIDLAPEPFSQFLRWYEAARAAELPEPDAAVLATAGATCRPSARHVLVRSVDDRGFAFFTNYESRKAAELTANPHAALVFPWIALRRQVEAEGAVERLTSAESDAYFTTRPRGSQLSAWASNQSRTLPDRDTLERRYAEEEARWDGRNVERPPHWGGYRLTPETVEFWQGRPNRLHDRLRYVREADSWRVERLAP